MTIDDRRRPARSAMMIDDKHMIMIDMMINDMMIDDRHRAARSASVSCAGAIQT